MSFIFARNIFFSGLGGLMIVTSAEVGSCRRYLRDQRTAGFLNTRESRTHFPGPVFCHSYQQPWQPRRDRKGKPSLVYRVLGGMTTCRLAHRTIHSVPRSLNRNVRPRRTRM
jgi:hypothetical protein